RSCGPTAPTAPAPAGLPRRRTAPRPRPVRAPRPSAAASPGHLPAAPGTDAREPALLEGGQPALHRPPPPPVVEDARVAHDRLQVLHRRRGALVVLVVCRRAPDPGQAPPRRL